MVFGLLLRVVVTRQRSTDACMQAASSKAAPSGFARPCDSNHAEKGPSDQHGTSMGRDNSNKSWIRST